MPIFGTDEPLWYNVGIWGELGYAVPNFGDNPSTLNTTTHYLASVIGRNLQAIMLHPDADLRRPPSINTLLRVDKLILRARSILAGRAVPAGKPDMESVHTSPAETVFIIHPCPYFRVRNAFLKEWCGLCLNALSEAFQHTDNRKAYEISDEFAGIVGQYLQRVYKLMATELFGVPVEDANKPDFTLSDTQKTAYDPSKFFTSTEMVDTLPPLYHVPTEDDLEVLTNGIPATLLVNLQRYPSGADGPSIGPQSETAKAGSAATAASTGAWKAAPTP